jgi:hypothetical protein
MTTFGDSILKLTPKTLTVFDYFTPFDQAIDQGEDLDLGSGGPVLLDLKDNSGVTHNLLVVAGKDKKIYVADRSKLGKQTPNNSGIYQAIGPVLPQVVFGPGAFLNGAMYWVPRFNNPMEKFVFSNAKLGTSPAAKSTVAFPPRPRADRSWQRRGLQPDCDRQKQRYKAAFYDAALLSL